MDVIPLPARSDNYIYVLHGGTQAAVVDPGEAGPVRAALSRLGAKLESILLTHHHGDHTAGAIELRTETGCAIVGPDDDRLPFLDRRVGEGDAVQFAGMALDVMAVPGHTRTHVAYYSSGEALLFSGDTLFAGGCGRLLEGTARDMWESLRRLRALPPETRIYCGHEYTEDNLEFAAALEPDNVQVRNRLAHVRERLRAGEPSVPSTLAEERLTNPFLRVDEEPVRLAAGLPNGLPADVLAEIRRRKDRW